MLKTPHHFITSAFILAAAAIAPAYASCDPDGKRACLSIDEQGRAKIQHVNRHAIVTASGTIYFYKDRGMHPDTAGPTWAEFRQTIATICSARSDDQASAAILDTRLTDKSAPLSSFCNALKATLQP